MTKQKRATAGTEEFGFGSTSIQLLSDAWSAVCWIAADTLGRPGASISPACSRTDAPSLIRQSIPVPTGSEGFN
jgi:predicted pyridoxine 5'-phosphate oxidase superfamily flavin-nucleotide-binding protein